MNMVLGTFTAFLLASFMVFFAEMGRATIATPRELDRLSRYPLLATVPFDRGNGKALHRRPKSERLSITLTPDTPADTRRSKAFENLLEDTQAS
jgi:hypothetical protein